MSVRDYCFTSFDVDEELKFDKDNIRYICYGREVCPTSDREHYQGFAIFKRTARMPRAKVWIGGGSGTHLEPRRGSRDQARDYCRKSDGEFFEWGEYEGLTNEQVLQLPKNRILMEYPLVYCRYWRAINDRQERGPTWRGVKVEWLWGEAGCGKTRKVMEMESVYKLDWPYKWFCGYQEEDILLIDDYRDGAIERGQMLNLLDGYRQKLETKGGHCWALWTKVYVTSNMNPKELVQWDKALARRCDTVTGLGVILSPS